MSYLVSIVSNENANVINHLKSLLRNIERAIRCFSWGKMAHVEFLGAQAKRAPLVLSGFTKRTSVLGNPPNEKLFVYKKWSTCQRIGNILFFSYIESTIGQCVLMVIFLKF